jgi:hypothetical protein
MSTHEERIAAWEAKDPTPEQLDAAAYVGFGDTDASRRWYAKRMRPEIVLAATDPSALVPPGTMTTVIDRVGIDLTAHDAYEVQRFAALLVALGQTGGNYLTKDVAYASSVCPYCYDRKTVDVSIQSPWDSDDYLVRGEIACPMCQGSTSTRAVRFSDLEWLFEHYPFDVEDVYKLDTGILTWLWYHVRQQIRSTQVVVTLPDDVWDAYDAMIEDARSEADAARWG